MTNAITEYLKMIGRKGGSTKGKTKRRGSKEYYREMGLKSAEARRKNKLKLVVDKRKPVA